MYFIGLDVGTSGVKALCMDERGTVEKICRIGYGFRAAGKGTRELDPEEVWRAVCRCLKTVGGVGEIEAITVSSLGEAVIAADAEGNCLTGGITGTDERGRSFCTQFVEKAGRRKVTGITGLPASPLYSLGKILWMKERAPEIFERTRRIFAFQDFIVYRLCGVAAVDVSVASRTMLLDYRAGRWSPWMFEQAGIPMTLMSKVVKPGSIVGEMKQSLQRELGIKGKTRIVNGCHDHIANALGAGVCRPGESVNAAGTTEGITAVIRPGVLDAGRIEAYQVSCEPFAVAGLYNTVAWSNASGSVLKWFVERILGGGEDLYEKLDQSIKYRPSPAMALPHFAGAATPYMNDHSKGALLGLTLEADREEIYQALVEATQMELCLIYSCLQDAGVSIDRITATGGATSKEILQLKADILGREVYTVDCRETGAAGSAMLGATACGVYESAEQAASCMVREKECFIPDMERHKMYEDRQKIYNRIYGQLESIHEKIG